MIKVFTAFSGYDSQQYKLAGNSIVVNVLTEILRKLLVDTQNDDRQLRMF